LPQLIREASQLVLDADALNTIAGDPDKYLELLCDRVNRFNLPPAVLTPHPGEFRRLAPDLDLRDRQQSALELARRCSSVVILKGASTVVADPAGQIWINPTGHDGLARGGSGDVLCGLLAGLLAQGLQPVAAALCGVYLHGLAAEAAAERLSRRTMLPGDLIDSLGEAFRRAGWDTV
jgi:NAD(P)H-hydrate epimerase